MAIKFYRTREKYGPFSNFSRHQVELDGKVWPTSEHYYQAMKFEDEGLQERVRLCEGPGRAAEMGRDRSLPLRTDWEEAKYEVMKLVVRAKVLQHEEIYDLLMESGHEVIIEDSPIDYYWGCGHDGSGKNKLGRVLMEIRDEFRDLNAQDS